MIIFDRFIGRLGNNIAQLNNIIHIALELKHNIKLNVEKLSFFDLKIIEKYFEKYDNNEIITDENHFFKINYNKFPKEIFKQNVRERNEILRKAFLLKNIEKLNENDLVVHIRSGDIFSSNPHPGYVPPPLSYYVSEINKFNYDKIHIVCEDTLNPVINELLKIYKNANYEIRTLEKDIRIILGASNIVQSIGTFIPQLMLFSDNIKLIHRGFSSTDEYNKIMRPWRNKENQREYILTYDYK